VFAKELTDKAIVLPDAPAIAGLTFRRFRGEVDYPAMLAVIDGSKEADGIERTDSVEDIARNYEHLTNCDPFQDMLFAEVDGQVISYSRVTWNQTSDGERIQTHFNFMLPEWRGQGIRRAMLHYNERRLREIAAGHPPDGRRWFEAWAADTEEDWESLLIREGYEAVRHAFEMVRPHLNGIPALPLPEELEVRPAKPKHYRPIWEAAKEAFRDSWQYSEDWFSDEAYESWQQHPTFQPELWQIAWDGDQVAGMVRSYIHQEENEEYGRKRGYTEDICVRRPWRRRGLARALIARSFGILKEQGMEEAALGVDTQNQNGALQLYESMGFRPVKRHSVYRKLMD
jgi:GNAT superfamily N-acetyltransferase